MLDSGERLIRGLWAGCLWTLGYLVAPVLFATLDDRALAGRLAGAMFTAGTLFSLAAATVLAAIYLLRRQLGGRLWLTVSAASVLAINQWGLRPLMEAARLPDGSAGEAFGRLHGLSSVLWLLASLIVLALASLGPPRVRRAAG